MERWNGEPFKGNQQDEEEGGDKERLSPTTSTFYKKAVAGEV